MSWICQREEKGCHRNLLADLIQTDIPSYHNLSGFLLHQEVIEFQNPLQVGLKLAITLRHLKCTHPYSITGWLPKPPYANSSLLSAGPSMLNSSKVFDLPYHS